MENATKALLIAAGVLIAIIILTMFLSTYNRISGFSQSQEQAKKEEQISDYNAEFEAFNKKLMYSTDVVSLINKVINNNEKYQNSPKYIVAIYIKIDGSDITISKDTSTEYSDNIRKLLLDNKVDHYRCVQITYNSYGRVSSMTIEKIN